LLHKASLLHKEWIASSLHSARNDGEHTFAISPQVSREFCHHVPPSKTEGAGNAGRWARPQPHV
jgi:hypothetical protein